MVTINEELTLFFKQNLNDVPPIPYTFKDLFHDRWVRFHSLPESKRYPDNEEETEQILYRDNTLLTELFGIGSELIIVLPEFSDKQNPDKPEPIISPLFPSATPWTSIAMTDEDDNIEFYWHLHSEKVKYTGEEFNALLRIVANDEAADIMIISPSKAIVFHPYDGGADVILPTKGKRDELKGKFSQWLSSHPDGL